MSNDHLTFLIKNLSLRPGVYLMKDKHGKIIYIGKANNLKNRVSQYFTRPQTGKVKAMVSHITSFETIITENEKEALILELKLIQTHYPRYNIMLRDDSHYPYIALTKSGPPIVKIERKANKNHLYYYFGPFPASQNAYRVVDIINKIFPTKKCKSHSKEPCFYYHLGQCLGYCFQDVAEEDMEHLRQDIRQFLNGKNKDKLHEYEVKMKEASALLAFEKALDYKNIVTAINHVYGSQKVELKKKIDADIIAFTTNEHSIGLLIVSYRGGIRLSQQFEVIDRFDNLHEQLTTLILQYYENRIVPSTLILGNELLAHNISLVYESKIIVPQAGQFVDILNNALQNANEELRKHLLFHQQNADESVVLTNLASLLNITYPRHIDLVDIAHLSGEDALGVITTFINGRPFKKLYRKYNIEHDNKADDYESMREVILRHYLRRIKENQPLPDLLIVDGGKGQLNAVNEVLQTLNVDFKVYGLVKNNKHQTRALLNEEDEEVILPSALLNFLSSMQEEVHRYAITAHRGKRIKSSYQSAFSGIAGLGPKRAKLLLDTYGTLEAIKASSVIELSQLIPERVAILLLESLDE